VGPGTAVRDPVAAAPLLLCGMQGVLRPAREARAWRTPDGAGREALLLHRAAQRTKHVCPAKQWRTAPKQIPAL